MTKELAVNQALLNRATVHMNEGLISPFTKVMYLSRRQSFPRPSLSKDQDRRILFMRYADADAVEVYNGRQPRLGRLVRGATKFDAVREYEAQLPLV